MSEHGITITGEAGIRRYSLLAIRGVLRLRLAHPKMVTKAKEQSARRGLAHWYPDETIPADTEAALAWLEDRLDAEGPTLLHRYTPRKENADV